MLKLVYHTVVFGPIDLEYHQPVIRVGRAPDNDLVLPDASVMPYHCILVFRGDKVLCLPPDHELPCPDDLWSVSGVEFGHGDELKIGKLFFKLAHSRKTIAVHQTPLPSEPKPAVPPTRYYCNHCQVYLQDAEVKRVGLVGHPKIELCPRCSRVVQPPAPHSATAGM